MSVMRREHATRAALATFACRCTTVVRRPVRRPVRVVPGHAKVARGAHVRHTGNSGDNCRRLYEAGPFERLDDFTKTSVTPVPVTEIQALVVQ